MTVPVTARVRAGAQSARARTRSFARSAVRCGLSFLACEMPYMGSTMR